MGFFDVIRHGWHAMNATDQPQIEGPRVPVTSSSMGSSRPYVNRVRIANEKSIINSIYTTMSVDVSDIELRHADTDPETGAYKGTRVSKLQRCLSVEANLDQAARAFRRDIARTMMESGTAVVMPIEATGDPVLSGDYDISSMRVGTVVDWSTHHVQINAYDDRPGQGLFKNVWMPKSEVAIVENPFYSVMNEPNSTLQRLIRKLGLLDMTDENQASGKLDMIVQLPYTIRSEARRQQAEARRKDIEFQLSGTRYGIAYTDGAEKITQLNRPVENNLLEQITALREQLMSELGITAEIMNGTADADAMINYMSRTIEPFVDAIAEEFHRKFLTKTAQTKGQKILYFRDPFKLIPVTRLAEITDVLSRNEIASPNDIRQAIGWVPSSDKAADQLHNSNMPERPSQIEGASQPELPSSRYPQPDTKPSNPVPQLTEGS